jgi:hypothetical protein
MSDPRIMPDGPYEPQPSTPQPSPGPEPMVPGHTPAEVPTSPEPIGIPATDPDRAPGPGFDPGPGPSIPSDPQPRA